MADILIKGMEMPHDCDECRLCAFIPVGDYGIHRKCLPLNANAEITIRRTDCPLVPVPEHGWIPVTERLPECDLGAEVGNIEWISYGRVYAGCFGRGGKYRDAYFRTWTDAGEGIDAKEADYWRAVTLPEPPKEET